MRGCEDLGVAHQICSTTEYTYTHIYFIFYPPKNHMWCDANKWVHLILSLSLTRFVCVCVCLDCFHSHLLPYCFILTRKVAIKISNTHFPSQVCLPTPSIIWHPTCFSCIYRANTHSTQTHVWGKSNLWLRGLDFCFRLFFLVIFVGFVDVGGNSPKPKFLF